MSIAQSVSTPNQTGTTGAQRTNSIGRWLRRMLAGGFILLLVLTGAIWLAGRWAKAQLTQQFPPPGKLVNVGGYQLHLDCRGQSSPTVLLEAGLGDFSVQWAHVQPAVAQFSRVCSYDRAGLGWSEASPRPRTPETMAEELHTLLRKAGERGPYLLVGHSFGGILMRRFVHQYPESVVAMLLVDSAHEEQATRIPAFEVASDQLRQQFHLLSQISSFGLLALAPNQIPNRGLPEAALAQYRACLATSAYFETALAENAAFYNGAPSSMQRGSLGDLPLIVLSRGQPLPLPGVTTSENEDAERTWRMLQAELVALSSEGQQQIAAASSHDIHLQQPDRVVAAIRQLLQSR